MHRHKHKSVSKKRSSTIKRKTSKQTWEQFLKRKDSLKVLKESWKSPNPQKVYEKKIRLLHKKYSSNKKR